MPGTNRKSRKGGTSTQRAAVGSRVGKKRPRTDPTVARTNRRASTARVQGALAEAGADRAWLDAEAARVNAIVAEWDAERRARRAAARAAGEVLPPLPLHDLTNRTAGDIERWNLGQAGVLLDDGYSLEHVCRKTGWGGWWFRHRVGNDGYVRPLAEWSA